ncbi:MAG: DUF5618 family protein [Ignavibacteria bacterium]|nr:DUF5618 family protein [Ignavibacteria bacterium]
MTKNKTTKLSELSISYLSNAREIFAKSPKEGKLYVEDKYVREGAEIAYLAALIAIDGYLVKKGVAVEKLPQSIEEYWMHIKKYIRHDSKFNENFMLVYQNLHICAHQLGSQSIALVKEGLVAVGDIIKLLKN